MQSFAAPGIGLPLLLFSWFVLCAHGSKEDAKSNLRWSRDASERGLLKIITTPCRLVRKMTPSGALFQKKGRTWKISSQEWKTGKIPHCLTWTSLVLLNQCFSSYAAKERHTVQTCGDSQAAQHVPAGAAMGSHMYDALSFRQVSANPNSEFLTNSLSEKFFVQFQIYPVLGWNEENVKQRSFRGTTNKDSNESMVGFSHK